MRRILVKRKDKPNGCPFMVYRQSPGFPYLANDLNDPINEEDLLFPAKNEVGRRDYELAALQGLMANPNIVKNIAQLEDENFRLDLLNAIDELTCQLYYDDVDVYEPKAPKK